MPGRRSPRRSTEHSTAQHADRAFSGALDGASALPAPVGEGDAEGRSKGAPRVFFHQDQYKAAGGAQTVVLTYLPIANSEHVYLYPGGAPSEGLYHREGKSWQRDAGKKSVSLFTGMNTRPGDVVVVEYAYYEQVPGTPSKDPLCIGAPVYPVVKLPDAATITMLGPGFYAPDRMSYSPPAVGMPSALTPEGDEYLGGFATNDNIHIEENLLHAGPSIAPGYTYSWESGPVYDKTQHTRGLTLWGGGAEPRLNTASYLKSSNWVKLVNYKKARPTDPTGGLSHDVDITLSARFMDYTFTYNPHKSEWSLYAEVTQWEQDDATFNIVPVPVTVDPYDGAAHRYEIAIDTATYTLTFTADSQSWSLTDRGLWPYGDYWESYSMRPLYLRGDQAEIYGSLFTGSYGSIGGGVYPTLRTAGATIETDAVWCIW